MTALERNAYAVPGPKFERVDGELLFSFVIDSSNVLGPRPATKADQEKHLGAWREFCAREGVSPLDRDADGSDGGSLPASTETVPGFAPKEEPLQERDSLRRDLTLLGVEFDKRWGVARLREELEKATKPAEA